MKKKTKKTKQSAMQSLSKNFIWAVVILLLVSALYSVLSGPLQEKTEIPLSEVVAKIQAGEVSKISINESKLTILLTDESEVYAQKEPETGLTETLENYSVDPQLLKGITIEVQSRKGMQLFLGIILPILGPVLLIVFFIWFMARQVQRGSMQAFSFGQTKARLISPGQKAKTTFKDVAGVPEAKEELKEVVDFLKFPKKFLELGAKIPKGVLLMGAPGTGKSLLAKAVSGEAGVPFFSISGSEFIEMFVGVGASRVRDTFRLAKKAAPAIIFVDEIDAVGRMRGAGLGGGHDEREQTLNQLLVEMDGMETDARVIIMAATNRPDVLDPALLRPGRFDRRVILDMPDIKDRAEILKIHARNKPLEEGTDLTAIAQRTPGFSGADLENLMNEAAILTARESRKQIAQNDIILSIDKVMLGPERKSRVLSEKEKHITAYHEAGHALVAASLPNADPVHKVTIVSRGRAGGYTLKLPTEERHLYSRAHFLDELAVSLGGYTAEKLEFDDITTGAGDDLKKATDLARGLVTRFGMSEKIGPVVLDEKDEMVFLGRELAAERNYSEETAQVVDSEIKRLLENARKAAMDVLTERKAKLDEIAAILIERETIEREEFETLVGVAEQPATEELTQ